MTMSPQEEAAREMYWSARAKLAKEKQRASPAALVGLLEGMNEAADALKKVGLHPLDLETSGKGEE